MKYTFILPAVLAFLWLTPARASSQDIAALFERASKAEENRQFGEATQVYLRAYAISGFDPVSLALASIAAAKGGADSVAIDMLQRATAEGFLQRDFLAYLERDSAFTRIRANPKWSAAVADAQRRYAALDQALRTELLELAARDQRNRAGFGEAIARYGRRSREGDSIVAKLASDDAPLIARLRAIVSTRGWPGRSLVADDGANAAWLLLQHAEPQIQREFFPLIQRAYARGEMRPGNYALLEDRIRVGQGKPQRFGSQSRWPDTPGAHGTLEPIEDEACVDVRRASVGLGPLKDYLRTQGIDYPGPPGRCGTR